MAILATPMVVRLLQGDSPRDVQGELAKEIALQILLIERLVNDGSCEVPGVDKEQAGLTMKRLRLALRPFESVRGRWRALVSDALVVLERESQASDIDRLLGLPVETPVPSRPKAKPLVKSHSDASSPLKRETGPGKEAQQEPDPKLAKVLAEQAISSEVSAANALDDTDVDILRHLAREDERKLTSQLVRSLGRPKGTLSKSLSKLVKMGLVDNKRRKGYVITALGKRMLAARKKPRR